MFDSIESGIIVKPQWSKLYSIFMNWAGTCHHLSPALVATSESSVGRRVSLLAAHTLHQKSTATLGLWPFLVLQCYRGGREHCGKLFSFTLG